MDRMLTCIPIPFVGRDKRRPRKDGTEFELSCGRDVPSIDFPLACSTPIQHPCPSLRHFGPCRTHVKSSDEHAALSSPSKAVPQRDHLLVAHRSSPCSRRSFIDVQSSCHWHARSLVFGSAGHTLRQNADISHVGLSVARCCVAVIVQSTP